MRKILVASIFVLTFCAFAFGQTDEKIVCPKISIHISELVVGAGEKTNFTANINASNSDKLEYQWSVDRGIIVDGQGTKTITVQADSYDGITAGVEIKGLPESCPNFEAGSTATVCLVSSYLVDQVDVLSDEITEERLSAWIANIESSPDARMYIIVYNNKKFPPKNFKEKISYIKKFLFDKNIKEANTLFILNADKDEDKMNNTIKMYIVPQGATPPMP